MLNELGQNGRDTFGPIHQGWQIVYNKYGVFNNAGPQAKYFND